MLCRPILAVLATILLAGAAGAQPVSLADSRTAAAAPDLGAFYLEDAADATFDLPVAVAFAPGGLMFVVEKRGVVWTVRDGVLDPVPFIDLQDEVLNHHDRGLLGMAVDPAFAETRRVFFAYVVDVGPETDGSRRDAFARVTRYTARADDPGRADLGSRRVILGRRFSDGIPACHNSHTIGTLAFGRDGMLLVGTGDGASYNEPDAGGLYDDCFGPGKLDPSEDIGAFRSQRLESLAGKILRVDPRNGRGLPSNPFWTGDPDDVASKVWVLGVRNPFRFAVDLRSGRRIHHRGRPGTLYVGDVGWNDWEEINSVMGGENLGWPCFEGPAPQPDYQPLTPATNGCDGPLEGTLEAPAVTWHHSDPDRSVPQGRTGASVVGGAIYPGTAYPAFYQNALFHGDYARGWAAVTRVTKGGQMRRERTLSDALGPVVAYAYDPESDLMHLVDIGAGRVWRLRYGTGGEVPVAAAAAAPASGGLGAGGLRVQFSPDGSAALGGGALTYAWAFGDGATSAERAPVHTYTAAGDYTATLTVSDGAQSATATVPVVVRPGAAPTVRILSPTRAARGETGTAIALAAEVADADQPADELFTRWTVVQVHDGHLHPDVFVSDDTEAAFVVPEHGAPGDRVSYRITAEVRDATGLTTSAEAVLTLGDWRELAVAGAASTSQGVGPDERGAELAGVVVDGVTPAPDAPRWRHVSTDGGDASWVQIETDGARAFSGVAFQEGGAFADGGWFEASPRVEVRQGGTWRAVTGLTTSPAYRADDGAPFDTYALAFAPIDGDAIRVVGPAGGASRFVTAAEVQPLAVADGLGPLPPGWSSADVGTPAGAGSAGAVDGAVVVVGGGDLAGSTDELHAATRPLAGDGSVVARVDALSPEPVWAKGGVTLRASLDGQAQHATLVLSNLGLHLQARTGPGGDSDDHRVNQWNRTAPIWLRLDRVSTTVTAYASDDGATWETVSSVEVPGLSGTVRAGLAVASADFGDGDTSEAHFSHVTVSDALAAPWTSTDVGTPITPGAARMIDGDVAITAGGDLWNRADAGHLVSQPLAGDGSVVARVGAPDGPWGWGKAGLTVRASTDADAANAWLGFATWGLYFQHRPTSGAPTAFAAQALGDPGPRWLRLDRAGPTISAFHSDDGTTWTPFGTAEVPGLGTGPALVGLAASSSDDGDGTTAEARFQGVAVTTGSSATAGLAVGFGLGAVYPNPARARATVHVTLAPGAEATLEVLDVLGRRIATVHPNASGPVALDLDGVPAGTYLVRLREGDQRATQRLTVVR
ncbi:PQQ-dependent sugar dehydrogenase [Rubrivirga sp. IMCC45206]|uniref:PQQ-dependent sugar dehydrogenase n=1 Tax=Rubrivirga sp. IMCC45206 TaxID=3391614 RepID=UPI00398FBAE5